MSSFSCNYIIISHQILICIYHILQHCCCLSLRQSYHCPHILQHCCSLSLRQSYHCPNASKTTLKNMGENQPLPNHNKTQQSANYEHNSWDTLCFSAGWVGGAFQKHLRALKSKNIWKKNFNVVYKLHLSMYGWDILCGILKVAFEIPHKISHPYIERCVFYWRWKFKNS